MDNEITFLSDYSNPVKIKIPAGYSENAQLIQKNFPSFISAETLYNKWDINYQKNAIQDAYIEIRDDFIKSVFYDLNKEEYSNYALILWMDLEDAFPSRKDDLPKLFNLGLLLIKCCNSIKHRVLHSLFQIYQDAFDYDCIKLLFDYDEHLFTKVRLSWSVWGYFILNKTGNDIQQLEKLGQYNFIEDYIPSKCTFTIQNLIEIYLIVLSKIDDEAICRSLPSQFYHNEYAMYEGLMCKIAEKLFEKYDASYKARFRYCSLDYNNIPKESLSEFELKLGEAISSLKYNENIEKEINSICHLWNKKIEKIKLAYKENKDVQLFTERIDRLIYLHELTDNIRILYVLACKELANINSASAIKYYALACEAYDTTIPTLIGKRIKSMLFPRQSDFERFEAAFNSKDLSYYTQPESRTIKIDETILSQRLTKYEKTAATLSELLKDEEDSDNQLNISERGNRKPENEEDDLFELFILNDFILADSQISAFANKKNLMLNAMIDRINEKHYEALDDCIIEEQDGKWILNKDYYEQIKQ